MNPDQIVLIQQTYEPVLRDPDAATAQFYTVLFALDPTLRPLFRGSMDVQRGKLAQLLSAAVNGLWDLDALVPVLQQLGQRHRSYGVQPAHYATVGIALIATLREANGAAWSAEAEHAWQLAYLWISQTMHGRAAE